MDRLGTARTANPGSTLEEQRGNCTQSSAQSQFLERTHFTVSRSAEYFDVKELQAQTGQPVSSFGEVVLKEIFDNGLDTSESVGNDPEIEIGFATSKQRLRLCIRDNGSGINPELLEKIVNYETRTSDKAAYKSPSRGAQGNALKTIIGIPYAMGGGSIITESCGLRHEIIATANPADLIDINREAIEIQERVGTTIYVDLPYCNVDVFKWAQAFAIFNPHATIKISQFDDLEFTLDAKSDDFCKTEQKVIMVTSECENSENTTFYQKVADCKKIKPNAPTSSHWYDPQTFSKLVFLQAEQHDITIRDFVRQFDGISYAKAKKISAQFTEKKLSDMHRDPVKIERLLLAMQSESRPVQPKALGAIGKDNMLARLTIEGRSWFKQVSGMIDNVPHFFEILIAGSEEQAYYFGVNHSATFGDYLRQSRIKAGELWGTGIEGVLDEILQEQHIVVVHLIGIGLPFLDRGKSTLSLPDEMIESISGAVWKVSKELYSEHKKREKDAAKADRDYEPRRKENDVFLKDAVFAVLSAAIQAATAPIRAGLESLPTNVRNLFYKVRDAIQEYTDKPLGYAYFSQNILIRYWQEHGCKQINIQRSARPTLHAAQ